MVPSERKPSENTENFPKKLGNTRGLQLKGDALQWVRDGRELREVVYDDAEPAVGTLPGGRFLGELLHLRRLTRNGCFWCGKFTRSGKKMGMFIRKDGDESKNR